MNSEQIQEQIAELRIYPGRGGPMGKAADSLESLLAENERLIAGCEMKDKRIDWTVEDNVKKAIEIERLTTENESLRAVYEAADACNISFERGCDCLSCGPAEKLHDALVAVQKEQQPPHGAAITMDDDGKIRTILDDSIVAVQKGNDDECG